MLREIELREVRIKDVSLGRQQKRVTLMIRKSKMDQAARGVRRTLACICQSGNCNMSCPWALALVVLGRRDSARREDHLFATVAGGKATKDAMTKAWQTLLCEEIKGHSPRRTGAMHYVRMGMAIQDLAYLGRWKSQAVLRYAEEALEDQPVNETFIQREEMKSMIQRNRKTTSQVIEEDERRGKGAPEEEETQRKFRRSTRRTRQTSSRRTRRSGGNQPAGEEAKHSPVCQVDGQERKKAPPQSGDSELETTHELLDYSLRVEVCRKEQQIRIRHR